MTYKELLEQLERIKDNGKIIENMEVRFYINKEINYPINLVELKPIHHSELEKHIALKL
jgi:hypothetical protein